MDEDLEDDSDADVEDDDLDAIELYKKEKGKNSLIVGEKEESLSRRTTMWFDQFKDTLNMVNDQNQDGIPKKKGKQSQVKIKKEEEDNNNNSNNNNNNNNNKSKSKKKNIKAEESMVESGSEEDEEIEMTKQEKEKRDRKEQQEKRKQLKKRKATNNIDDIDLEEEERERDGFEEVPKQTVADDDLDHDEKIQAMALGNYSLLHNICIIIFSLCILPTQ